MRVENYGTAAALALPKLKWSYPFNNARIEWS